MSLQKTAYTLMLAFGMPTKATVKLHLQPMPENLFCIAAYPLILFIFCFGLRAYLRAAAKHYGSFFLQSLLNLATAFLVNEWSNP
jgi:hypothetical protein